MRPSSTNSIRKLSRTSRTLPPGAPSTSGPGGSGPDDGPRPEAASSAAAEGAASPAPRPVPAPAATTTVAPTVAAVATSMKPGVADPPCCSRMPAATNPRGPVAEMAVITVATTRARSSGGVRTVRAANNRE